MKTRVAKVDGVINQPKIINSSISFPTDDIINLKRRDNPPCAV